MSSPQVVDGFNLNYFSRPAISWILQQKFRPGTLNGVPSLFHWNAITVFKLRGLRPGVRNGFAYALKPVDKLLSERRYGEAKDRILKLQKSRAKWLEE